MPDSRSKKYPQGTIVLFVLVAVVAFLSQLGSFPLLEPDEGRYGEIAREMAEPGGDWLIPKLIGVPHFQKPPFFYWTTALSIKTFGVNETAVRLPGALAGVLTLLFSMGIASRLFGPNAMKPTLLVLASSPLFLVLARLTTPDMTMTMWITASIYCLVRSRDHRRWGWLFFVCAGLGFLTKGPVAFLIPFSAAIGWLIMSRRFDSKSPFIPWVLGIPLALLIGLSWFLVVVFHHPELATYFWEYELVQRLASSNHGRNRPFWFFIPVLLGGILPWSLVLLRQIPNAWKYRSAELGLFLGWIAVPFVILSLSGSKLPTYVLPLFPGFAVLLGSVFTKLDAVGKFEKCFPRWLLYLMAGYLIVISLIPGAVKLFTGFPHDGSVLTVWIWVPVFVTASIFWLVQTVRNPTSQSILVFAGLASLVWLVLPTHVTGWNDVLEQQASVKPLAKRILKESENMKEPPRVVLCNVRASGMAFYLESLVENTRGNADIPHGLEKNDLYTSLPKVLHKSIKDVSRLEPESASCIFVLTRKKQQKEHFDAVNWELLQTAGDFVLLRRKALNPSQTASPNPSSKTG